MLWLGNVLVTLFGSLASFFAAYVSKKVALTAAALASFAALTAAFAAAVKALITTIIWTLPDWAAAGAGLFLPPNLAACLGALFAARVARWIYEYHVQNLKIASYIT